MRNMQYIPRTTEKAYSASTQNTYVFYVPLNASKQEIAKNISEGFKVTVLDVRTAVRKGKKTRFSRGRHAYPGITYRQDRKVAYITVKEGDKIPIFEEEQVEAKADKKAEPETKETEAKKAKTTRKAKKAEAKEEE